MLIEGKHTRMQEYNRYCIGFIEFMLKGKD